MLTTLPLACVCLYLAVNEIECLFEYDVTITSYCYRFLSDGCFDCDGWFANSLQQNILQIQSGLCSSEPAQAAVMAKTTAVRKFDQPQLD